MSMELDNTFTVPVPPDVAWDVLLDVARIAPCMPGATVDEVDGDVVTGRIKVKLGPVSLTYRGTAKFNERDEAAHTILVEASGKETRGAGTAAATIRASLEPADAGATLVNMHTSMNVTGRPAQFGRGVMVEVSAKLIDQFASNLAQQLSADASAPAADAVADGAAVTDGAATAAGADGAAVADSTEAGAGAARAAADGAVDADSTASAMDSSAADRAAVADGAADAHGIASAVGQSAADNGSATMASDSATTPGSSTPTATNATAGTPAAAATSADTTGTTSADTTATTTSAAAATPTAATPAPARQDSINVIRLVGPAILKRVLPVAVVAAAAALIGRKLRRTFRRGGKD